MNFLIVGLGASVGAILRNELTLLQSKIKIDFHLSNFAFCGTSDQFLIFCF